MIPARRMSTLTSLAAAALAAVSLAACGSASKSTKTSGDTTTTATVDVATSGPQVTYHGHPLYLFAGDSGPGDTNGQGSDAFGAAWLALSPAGNAITAELPGAGGGGAGYGRHTRSV